MRAVWSFWSKPYLKNRGSTWLSHRDYLYSCVLSFECARRHFSETQLYTDDRGAEILVDGLGLPYSVVSTALNELDHCDDCWWAAGKLYTYSRQSEAFLHIDNDAYLWSGLPGYFQQANVIGQNPEYFKPGSSWYRPEKFDAILDTQNWLPEALVWYRSRPITEMAVCCGIFGGGDVEFIGQFATEALKLIEYATIDVQYQSLYGDNLLLEQYLVAAYISYYQHTILDSKQPGFRAAYLFDSADEAFTPAASRRMGYTHLIGGAKRNRKLMKRLESRIYNNYPDYYRRIENITALRSFADIGG